MMGSWKRVRKVRWVAIRKKVEESTWDHIFKGFLIHSSADGHLGCFHVLAIIKLWYIYTMEYYSAVKKNSFESVLMRWIKLILKENLPDKFLILSSDSTVQVFKVNTSVFLFNNYLFNAISFKETLRPTVFNLIYNRFKRKL